MAQPEKTSGVQALVFGASGLAGWAVVDQLMENYPTQGTFSKVTALVNRSLNIEESYWPTPSPSRPELELVSSIDLTEGTVEEFTASLKKKVPDIANVTHMFYFAYKYDPDPEKETQLARSMLERAIGALNHLSPQLEFVVFPTGTKAYGVHIPGGVFPPPYTESMRLPELEARKMFYYALQDGLTSQSQLKQWTWCEVRPDIIIGFVPHGAFVNLAGHWATYLSTYALVSGRGARVHYPGTLAAYNALFTPISATTLARFSIWASLHPSVTGGGQLFNIADREQPTRMREVWPAVAGYFGLEGVGPVDEGDDERVMLPGDYLKANRRVLEERTGGKATEVFQVGYVDALGLFLTFDRQMSLEKARGVGWVEEREPGKAWGEAFERFRRAGVIPG